MAALDSLDAFARRFHECEHGHSGYLFAACPFGCDELVAATATIVNVLDDVHGRERHWSQELGDANLNVSPDDLTSRSDGAVPKLVAEAAAAYREAARTLFMRGHGRSEETIAALDLIERELVCATGALLRATYVIDAELGGSR